MAIMNDPKSIFRALTTGISFDKKRFRTDAEKFGLTGKKFEDSSKVKEFVSLPDLPIDFNEESNDATTTNGENSDSSEEQELQLLGKYISQVDFTRLGQTKFKTFLFSLIFKGFRMRGRFEIMARLRFMLTSF